MKKMILPIIIGAIVLFLGIGLFNANKLKEIHIQKTVTINGTEKEVFNQVLYLENFPKWSPFLEADPSQKVEVKGTDGKVGTQYHWEGNKGKDLGYQEIKEINSLKFIKMECDIQKPFKANPVFDYSFSKINDGVKVTQDFYLKSGTVDAFFMWIFGAKKEMSKMNERGMELLKKSIEKK